MPSTSNSCRSIKVTMTLAPEASMASRSMERSLSHAPPAECGSCLPGANVTPSAPLKASCGITAICIGWLWLVRFLLICSLLFRVWRARARLIPPYAVMNAEHDLRGPRDGLTDRSGRAECPRQISFAAQASRKTVNNPFADDRLAGLAGCRAPSLSPAMSPKTRKQELLDRRMRSRLD